jgi:MFS transporter, DHA3 family, macrolide efflux protein
VALGGGVLLLGLNHVPGLSLLLLALFGILVPLVNLNIITVIQGTTPSEIRGRVVGILGTLVLGLMPVAQGLSGFLIDALDQQVAVIYAAVGLVSMLLTGLAWSTREFREFLSTPIM